MPDPAPMTDAEIAEAEARHAASTPGRWTVGDRLTGLRSLHPLNRDYFIGPPAGPVVIEKMANQARRVADATFIAHAHDDVPRLLATVRARDEEIERLRAEVRTLRNVAVNADEKAEGLRAELERLRPGTPPGATATYTNTGNEPKGEGQ